MDLTQHTTSTIFFLALLSGVALATDVSYDGAAIKINGQRRLLISGSIHYPRSTPEMWPDLIQKSKDGGLDTIETYVFWNAHEPRKREYNFDGNLDLVRFIKVIQDTGLYVILRIGPYACAEWNYGGFPGWLHQIPGIKLRTNNQLYKDEVQTFVTYIVNMMKEENLFAPQGGPIILAQIENEYGKVMHAYGEPGKSYLQWCADMAAQQNIGVPWIMCKQSDAPQPVIDTCNGFYCHNFQPNNANSPKIWTENWTGWFKYWDNSDPHRPAEDIAYAVARFYQTGGTLQNYYMYHGGTNFGRTAGGPYITTSYDYDAPLDEYGNLRQPKWGHLKELHSALRMMEKALLYGTSTNLNVTNGLLGTKYSAEGTSACFLANPNDEDATEILEGNQYSVPARSVSLILECIQEVYNTAKVNVQTSIMTTKPNQAENEPVDLSWSCSGENMTSQLEGMGSCTENGLMEQLLMTGDVSDYLWYITSVVSPTQEQMTLHVNTSGHVLHAFVNGDLVGSYYAPNRDFEFVFKQAVNINAGRNVIALLSATVGLKNYGSFFDEVVTGIAGGPVQLIGDNNTIDLSTNQWSYQIGLRGMEEGFYLDRNATKSSKPKEERWNPQDPMTCGPFSWYKTTFRAPLGTDAVVIDLMGMGKGEAWVNCKSIGRYWANYIANSGECGTCDYRTRYHGRHTTCRTGCGQVSQRYYHVPRSFLKADEPNSLILFEEAGGNPSQINFRTVTIGAACAKIPEGKTLTLSCKGDNTITSIEFASFGDVQGVCGQIQNGLILNSTFKKGICESPSALSYVEQACIGKASCSIIVSEDVLGKAGCGNKKLAVVAIC